MGNFMGIAVSFCLAALVFAGAARMGCVAGDYIVAVQAAQQEECSMSGVYGIYYGSVNNRPANLVLQDNQRFSVSINSTETETRALAGEYSVVDGTFDLRDEESGRKFILAFDGENAYMIDMFPTLFTIFVICVLGDLLWRLCVIKLAWSAWKVVLMFVCLPLLIVFMVFAGMMALALTLLVVVGIVAIAVSIFK